MRPPGARSEPDPRAPVALPLLLRSLMTLDDPKVEVMMPDVTNQADKEPGRQLQLWVQLCSCCSDRRRERKEGGKKGRRRKKRADLEKKRPTVLEIIDSDQSADVYNTCVRRRHVDRPGRRISKRSSSLPPHPLCLPSSLSLGDQACSTH